jgi:xanthine dehydrogenase accessory factor
VVSIAFAPLDADALARWPEAAPLFHLQLHGAGHVGRAIATLLATLDCDVDWYDERDDGFPATTALGSPWPPHIRTTSADTVEREVANAPAAAFYLVLTHEHALDLRIVEAVLRRGDFAYCGLIGSKTKRASFARRLAARGVADDAIARLTCPIGIEGVEGKSPSVIAAAVVAQLLVRAERESARDVAAGERDGARR